MTEPAQDWEKTLAKVPYRGLERGTVVYERVRHGMRNGHTKWNKARVVDSNRSAVRIRFEADGRETMMSYADLYYEPPAPAPAPSRTVTSSEPPPAPAQQPRTGSDDEYQAWMAMGRDMLAAIDRQRTATESDLRDVATQLDQIDAAARKRIEALEGELVRARREYHDDRAFAATRHEQLTTKLAALNDRRHAMAALMGEVQL